jgi:acyl carrier protein
LISIKLAAFQAGGDAHMERPLAMHQEITRMLFGVIDELNQLRPTEEHLEKNLETPLAGDSGRLDSAGLINLIVVTEQKTAEELGVPILLTDDRTMSRVKEVFRTLGTLADYIQLLLNEKRDG